MTPPPSERGSGAGRLLVRAVPLAWLALFFLLPFGVVVKLSVSTYAVAQPPYRPLFDWAAGPGAWLDFARGLELTNYRMLLADTFYRDATLASLGYALAATAILLVLGTPLAGAMARAGPRAQPLLVALVVVPFWTSFLIRVYAWIAILKPDGLLNAALLRLHLIAAPLAVLDTPVAVLIGLVYAYLPFMVLPAYAVLARIDPRLREAAADLGAGPLRVFLGVTLPLALPGLAAGALLCFVPMLGEFVIPDLLGGSETLMLGRMLWTEFFLNRDWPIAAAVAVVLLVLVVSPLVLVRALGAREVPR